MSRPNRTLSLDVSTNCGQPKIKMRSSKLWTNTARISMPFKRTWIIKERNAVSIRIYRKIETRLDIFTTAHGIRFPNIWSFLKVRVLSDLYFGRRRVYCTIEHYITEVKKAVREQYGLINFGEFRKKIGFVSEKNSVKLNELIYSGNTQVRIKGKTIRIKTPVCRALRKLNQLQGTWKIRVRVLLLLVIYRAKYLFIP